MKRFSEMNLQEFRQIVDSSKELREKLDSRIQDSELDYLTDKLACVKSSLSNWSVGFYNRNFINVSDYEDFLDGVKKCANFFGASEREEKMIARCEKLLGTNLFEYYAKKLEEIFFEDELQPIIDFVEDASYELYCGKVGEKAEDYLELLLDDLDDYLYDEGAKKFYVPHAISA